ncbi:MAG TPA: glycosyltransferase family 1 protein [Chloroflexota bacterium]|nr:glycosyltransferase family 1 protein [Chloroflexota bacterium]
MRIGIDFACWANNRGYGRYTRNLLRPLLAANQGRHHYVGFADAETAQTADLPPGMELIEVALSASPTQAAASTGRRSLGDVWRMTHAVQRAGVDVIFFPSSYTYFPVLGGARPVVVIHDAIAERWPALIFPNRAGRLAWTLKTRLACWQAQRVVTVSKNAAQAITRHLPISPGRVRVIYEAADPIFGPQSSDDACRTPLLSRHEIPRAARIVLYVGGFGPHKNVGTLIEAFARLVAFADSADAPLHLVLVGQTDGEVFHSEIGRLRQQVQQRDVQGRVTFTGFVPDDELVHWYHAANCLALASRDEGFGLPVAEAMASGTPVVASRAGALPELVGDDAGLLVDAERPDDLAAALARIVAGDGSRARSLRAAGLRRAAELSWDRAALALEAVFDELEP